jgi:hypothetical protein
MNEYYQIFLEKSGRLSPEGLKALISKHYEGRFRDVRDGTVYMRGFFRLRDPGKVRFYSDDPSVLAVFSMEELENLEPVE